MTLNPKTSAVEMPKNKQSTYAKSPEVWCTPARVFTVLAAGAVFALLTSFQPSTAFAQEKKTEKPVVELEGDEKPKPKIKKVRRKRHRSTLYKLRKELKDIRGRLEEVEETVEGHDEKIGSRAVVSAFDAVKLDLGGFVDMAATGVFGEDTDEYEFNRQVFEILIKATLAEDWELFVAQAFLRKRGINFGNRLRPTFADLNSPVVTDTVIAAVTYRQSDLLNVQAGRFITPHGIINIEHFPATLLDPEQPQFLRPFAQQTIFANFTNGIHTFGTFFFDGDSQLSLKYNLYAGSFAGNATKLNAGGRLAVTYGKWGTTIGINSTAGQRGRIGEDGNYYVYGADLLIDYGPIIWKSEIYHTNEKVGDNRFAAYTQPGFRFSDKWIAFYRFDYLNTPASGHTMENVAGLNFKPNKNVRIRATYTHKNFKAGGTAPSTNADIIQVSTTLNF